MSLRTPQQYLDSLRDGRRVFYRGRRRTSPPTPVIGVGAPRAIDYEMAEQEAYRDLAVVGGAAATTRPPQGGGPSWRAAA